MSKDQIYVLVTGAASGIGLVITNYLSAKGFQVFATDSNKEALRKLRDRNNIHYIPMDVTDIKSIKSAFSQITTITQGLDVLINNAGIFVGAPLIEIKEEKMEQIVDVNILGVYRVTKHFFPLLHKNKGRIINIGSEAGRFAFPLNGPYSMTKYALEAFSDSLRRELMFLDMHVIHLQLGAINTRLLTVTKENYIEANNKEDSLFTKQLDYVEEICQNEQENCPEPIEVAKFVYKLIEKDNPKPRYRYKNNTLRRFLEFLPPSIADLAIKRHFQ